MYSIQTLWDIALRSIGHDIALPNPFAPRMLTIEERITGKLKDPSPIAHTDMFGRSCFFQRNARG